MLAKAEPKRRRRRRRRTGLIDCQRNDATLARVFNSEQSRRRVNQTAGRRAPCSYCRLDCCVALHTVAVAVAADGVENPNPNPKGGQTAVVIDPGAWRRGGSLVRGPTVAR